MAGPIVHIVTLPAPPALRGDATGERRDEQRGAGGPGPEPGGRDGPHAPPSARPSLSRTKA